MTIPEQAGKVATSAIDAMKSSPSCLAALLIVAIFATLQFVEDSRQNERMERRIDAVQHIMDRCYPNDGQAGNP